jgi:hypothetical protein
MGTSMNRFIGTFLCICGKKVRVYDWLLECVLCQQCEGEIRKQEEKATAHPQDGDEDR